jgi:hypothetical protein
MPGLPDDLEHDSEQDEPQDGQKALKAPVHDKMMRPKKVKKPEKKPWLRLDNEALWTPLE